MLAAGVRNCLVLLDERPPIAAAYDAVCLPLHCIGIG
jgi:hypothetical protein